MNDYLRDKVQSKNGFYEKNSHGVNSLKIIFFYCLKDKELFGGFFKNFFLFSMISVQVS